MNPSVFHRKRMEDLYNLAIEELGEDFVDNLMEKCHHYYDEYGSTIGEITGKEANDFVIYFDKKITKEEFNIIHDRIYKFPKVLAKSWEFAPKNIEIKDVIFGEFKNG